MKFNVDEYLKEEEKKEEERAEMLRYNYWESLYDPNEDAGDRV